MGTAKNMVIIGGIGLLIGAAMPWGTITTIFGQMSINGYEGDGIITGGIGLVLLIAGLLAKPKPGKRYSLLGGLIFLFTGWLAIRTMTNLNQIASDDIGSGMIQIGTGLYISIIAAIIGAIGGFTLIPPEVETSETPEEQQTTE